MTPSAVVSVENLSKRYRIYRRPIDRLRELVGGGALHHERVALDDVSFSVGRGEILGVIGRNGAGKSTLLKIITGVALPDRGRANVNGSITGLLELGTGFNPELSGLDNIGFNGALLGMGRRQIADRREAIIAFSGLGEAIDDPLKTYSTGMVMRLAFSIGIHADPACFLIDEALAVGDVFFQQKCFQRIREFQRAGGAGIFVSHDLNAVKLLCDRVLLLDRGKAVCLGDPDEAVNRYNQVIAPPDGSAGSGDDSAPRDGAGVAAGYGSRRVEIVAVAVVGERSGGAIVSAGERAQIRIKLRGNRTVDDLTVGLAIKDRFGQELYGTNTHHLGRSLELAAGAERTVVFAMPMNLAPGRYSVTAAAHGADTHLDLCYHWCDNAAWFEIAGTIGHRFTGACRLETTVDVV